MSSFIFMALLFVSGVTACAEQPARDAAESYRKRCDKFALLVKAQRQEATCTIKNVDYRRGFTLSLVYPNEGDNVTYEFSTKLDDQTWKIAKIVNTTTSKDVTRAVAVWNGMFDKAFNE